MFLSTFSASRAAVWRVASATAVSAALLTVAVSSTSAAPAPQPAQPAQPAGTEQALFISNMGRLMMRRGLHVIPLALLAKLLGL